MAKTPPNKQKRNALGRGLSALLDDNDTGLLNEKAGSGVGSISEIPLDQLETNPFQPRTEFDQEALAELAESIKVQGLIQPITVRKMGGGKYQLISGERRSQAARLAGLTMIPAYIRTANDEQMLEMALIENIQREDLNPIEIALAYERMTVELGLKHESLGEKVGKKRTTVNNYLRLLKLPPEIQIGLKEGKISMGHAKPLITLNPESQVAIFKLILDKHLSVRSVEELVKKLEKPGEKKSQSEKKSGKSPFLNALEGKLENKFGNRVVLAQETGGRGDIKIYFDSTEDLNRILEILNI